MVALTAADRAGIDNILANGGTYTLVIDASDIQMTSETEQWPDIAPNLTTGFELPLTPPTNPRDIALALRYGDVWGRELVKIGNKGGRVVYRKLPSGQYEAEITI
ncbi:MULTISPECIES: hypothetical protein [unclassified Rhizobium]|uniref:hypothetical protein n=1 Tax=unclassified Rhizobium TaxID=2613769 RepID=UPI001618A042|nr:MULTISPECIES: hypothetical protein [unclassified Rhizobium]MBB3521009.1 hypothetical protein [Rhizobium sp. BK456]MDR6664039.1 hypothetical protein [Rhizobium sp. 1399]